MYNYFFIKNPPFEGSIKLILFIFYSSHIVIQKEMRLILFYFYFYMLQLEGSLAFKVTHRDHSFVLDK